MRTQTRFFLSGRSGMERLARTRKDRWTVLDFMELPILELETARPGSAWEAASDAARCEELLGSMSHLMYDPAMAERVFGMRDRVAAVLTSRLGFPGADDLLGVLEVMES